MQLSETLPADDGLTARGLVRELGYRLGELVLSTPTTGGTRTTLIDETLNQYLPADFDKIGCWVYGAEAASSGNQGAERRARAWARDSSVLTLFSPGFPEVITAEGVYELHMRTRRQRKLRAVNDAVGQLYLYWYRELKDESLLTQVNTWRYDLPPTTLWDKVTKVEVQATTNLQLTGYPYLDGREFDWRAETSVDEDGVRTNWLQFGIQPPPGRIIRVWGLAYTQQLADDLDHLALDGKWASAALTWIYDYAEHLINKWETNRQPAGQSDRYRIMSLDRLNAMKEDLLRLAPAQKPARIIVPGRGDAVAFPRWAGSEYLGAFGNAH